MCHSLQPSNTNMCTPRLHQDTDAHLFVSHATFASLHRACTHPPHDACTDAAGQLTDVHQQMRYGHAHSAVNWKLSMPHVYSRHQREPGKRLHLTCLGRVLCLMSPTRCVCCYLSMTQVALATSKVGCVGIFGLDACFGRACSILRRAEWCGYCGVWSRGLDGLRTRQHWCMTPRCSSSGKATRPVGSLPLPLLRVCLTAPSVWCIVHRCAFAIFHVVNKEWWSEVKVEESENKK